MTQIRPLSLLADYQRALSGGKIAKTARESDPARSRLIDPE
jgi:hypothetical protein